MKRGFVHVPASLLSMTLLCGCVFGDDTSLSGQRAYADFVGAEYRVVADDLYAYGVYVPLSDKYDNKPIRYILLIPGVGIGGSEVAWKKPVPKGQVIKLLSAWHDPGIWFENSTYYVVALEGFDVPTAVPIRLQLIHGNGGAEVADLNPKIFSKILSQ